MQKKQNEFKNLHIENKPVQTNMLFSGTEGKVIALKSHLEKPEEHLSKVPALLVCVSGNAIYNEDNGTTVELKAGDFVHIKLMFNTASMLWPKAIFID
jgi:quercetin dioxygenase-like cupin family protein